MPVRMLRRKPTSYPEVWCVTGAVSLVCLWALQVLGVTSSLRLGCLAVTMVSVGTSQSWHSHSDGERPLVMLPG